MGIRIKSNWASAGALLFIGSGVGMPYVKNFAASAVEKGTSNLLIQNGERLLGALALLGVAFVLYGVALHLEAKKKKSGKDTKASPN